MRVCFFIFVSFWVHILHHIKVAALYVLILVMNVLLWGNDCVKGELYGLVNLLRTKLFTIAHGEQ